MRFPWNRAESELERELTHHLHELTAEYERQGHSHEEALRMAKREFGGSEQVKEQCRDERRWAWTAGLRQDVVFGARLMRRTPVITLAVVLSLALGIGANTAIISLMDVVLWSDLPVPNPRQLDLVQWQGHGFPRELADGASGSFWDSGGDFFSYPSFRTLRHGVSGRASLAAFSNPDTVSINFTGHPLVGQERPVSGNFFSTLQVRSRLGRLFSDNDDSDAAPPTVVLSHRLGGHAGRRGDGDGVHAPHEHRRLVGECAAGRRERGRSCLNHWSDARVFAPLISRHGGGAERDVG